jgi:hypothetical protein
MKKIPISFEPYEEVDLSSVDNMVQHSVAIKLPWSVLDISTTTVVQKHEDNDNLSMVFKLTLSMLSYYIHSVTTNGKVVYFDFSTQKCEDILNDLIGFHELVSDKSFVVRIVENGEFTNFPDVQLRRTDITHNVIDDKIYRTSLRPLNKIYTKLKLTPPRKLIVYDGRIRTDKVTSSEKIEYTKNVENTLGTLYLGKHWLDDDDEEKTHEDVLDYVVQSVFPKTLKTQKTYKDKKRKQKKMYAKYLDEGNRPSWVDESSLFVLFRLDDKTNKHIQIPNEDVDAAKTFRPGKKPKIAKKNLPFEVLKSKKGKEYIVEYIVVRDKTAFKQQYQKITTKSSKTKLPTVVHFESSGSSNPAIQGSATTQGIERGQAPPPFDHADQSNWHIDFQRAVSEVRKNRRTAKSLKEGKTDYHCFNFNLFNAGDRYQFGHVALRNGKPEIVVSEELNKNMFKKASGGRVNDKCNVCVARRNASKTDNPFYHASLPMITSEIILTKPKLRWIVDMTDRSRKGFVVPFVEGKKILCYKDNKLRVVWQDDENTYATVDPNTVEVAGKKIKIRKSNSLLSQWSQVAENKRCKHTYQQLIKCIVKIKGYDDASRRRILRRILRGGSGRAGAGKRKRTYAEQQALELEAEEFAKEEARRKQRDNNQKESRRHEQANIEAELRIKAEKQLLKRDSEKKGYNAYETMRKKVYNKVLQRLRRILQDVVQIAIANKNLQYIFDKKDILNESTDINGAMSAIVEAENPTALDTALKRWKDDFKFDHWEDQSSKIQAWLFTNERIEPNLIKSVTKTVGRLIAIENQKIQSIQREDKEYQKMSKKDRTEVYNIVRQYIEQLDDEGEKITFIQSMYRKCPFLEDKDLEQTYTGTNRGVMFTKEQVEQITSSYYETITLLRRQRNRG